MSILCKTRITPNEKDSGIDDLDVSDMSVDYKDQSMVSPQCPKIYVNGKEPPSSPGPHNKSFSPPYKRVRALRLFDSPLTPKTIIQKSCSTPTLTKTRLFSSERPRAVPTAYSIDKPLVNVNPFTPDGMKLTKKRSRSIRSLVGSPSPKINRNLNFDDSDPEEQEMQPTKRMALQENNISRYHKEFVELELIGNGEFGSVYKCINRLDGCIYAVKKSSKPVAGSAFEKAALNEVYAHAVLGKHQHVVRYYSAWAEDNHMIIQNEYCNGGALSDQIEHEPMDEQELRRLLLHVAEGLRYIHSESLVHMDIKPGNIFISREKKMNSFYEGLEDSSDETNDHEVTYKIGDLGHVTSIKNPLVEEGDCRYLSREVLQDDYTHLQAADVFSLGLTAIEALGYGPLPKNGEEWHRLRDGALPDIGPINNLSINMRDLIASMIDPNPVMRPTAVQILQHRALLPKGRKTKLELNRELNAIRLKNEILQNQLMEAAKFIKSHNLQDFKTVSRLSRIIGKKSNRSVSTTSF